jgi:hypothetical protein
MALRDGEERNPRTLAKRAEQQYFVLKLVEGEEDEEQIAFLDLGKDEELGQLVGMALYTTPDGEAQREDLNKYRGALRIDSASGEELLDTLERAMPTSVFLDGKKVAGSVFIRMLREELGIPIWTPRLIRWHQDPPG